MENLIVKNETGIDFKLYQENRTINLGSGEIFNCNSKAKLFEFSCV